MLKPMAVQTPLPRKARVLLSPIIVHMSSVMGTCDCAALSAPLTKCSAAFREAEQDAISVPLQVEPEDSATSPWRLPSLAAGAGSCW